MNWASFLNLWCIITMTWQRDQIRDLRSAERRLCLKIWCVNPDFMVFRLGLCSLDLKRVRAGAVFLSLVPMDFWSIRKIVVEMEAGTTGSRHSFINLQDERLRHPM